MQESLFNSMYCFTKQVSQVILLDNIGLLNGSKQAKKPSLVKHNQAHTMDMKVLFKLDVGAKGQK